MDAYGPFFPPGVWRAASAIERGVVEPGFPWFRPMTRYIVLRAAPGLPPGWMPRHLEGLWIDRPVDHERPPSPGAVGQATAHATGRYERRDDGALAEVYEFGPDHACAE